LGVEAALAPALVATRPRPDGQVTAQITAQVTTQVTMQCLWLQQLLRHQRPMPFLRPALLALLEDQGPDAARTKTSAATNIAANTVMLDQLARRAELASRLLCLGCPPSDALRLAAAAHRWQGGGRSHISRAIYQNLLQRADLPGPTLAKLGAFLIEHDGFSMSQYGLEDIARSGAMPDNFVAQHFAAAPADVQLQLCRFAEVQLEARGDEHLHHFMLNTAYGEAAAAVRAGAWLSLQRWYRHLEYGSRGPMKLSVAPLERFFGSVANGLGHISAILADPATFGELLWYEHLAELLRYPDPAVLSALVANEAATRRLWRVLWQTIDPNVASNRQVWSVFRGSAVDFLAFLGQHPAWQSEILATLHSLQGSDLEGAAQIGLDRLARLQK
jgi:hypothetical protein